MSLMFTMPRLTITRPVVARPLAFLLATALLVAVTGCQMPFLKQAVDRSASGAAANGNVTVTGSEDCVAQCDRFNAQCEQRQRIRETECQQHFQQIGADAATCAARNGRSCRQPVVCLGTDLGLCGIQRKECLQDCAERARSTSDSAAAPPTDDPPPESSSAPAPPVEGR